MRIHFVDNVCNDHYALVKGMRALGIDAHLFYGTGDGRQCQPEAEDPDIAVTKPDWLHPYPPQRTKFQPQDRCSQDLIDKIAACDLVIAQSVGLIWARRAGRPYIFRPLGTEMVDFIFYNGWLIKTVRGVPIPKVSCLGVPLSMRRAIADASAVLIGWHNWKWDKGIGVVKALAGNRIHRVHNGVDPNRFFPVDPPTRAHWRRRCFPELDEKTLVIFYPTRQLFTNPNRTTGYKANDRLYQALAKLRAHSIPFHLVAVDKGGSINDTPAAKAMIAELGFADAVTWVPFIDRGELTRWYWGADLVIDEFVSGGPGSLVYESLACGTPTMEFLRLEPEGYPNFLDPYELCPVMPPVLNVGTVEQITDCLRDLAQNRGKLAEIGAASAQWISHYGTTASVAEKILSIAKRILGGKSTACHE